MIVTDEQVALLRAYLTNNDVECERLDPKLDSVDYRNGFALLVATAFVEAVRRRFGENRRSLADIVRFVAKARSSFVEDADLLDPVSAELLVQGALGDRSAVADMNDQTKALGQLILLFALVNDEDLDDEGMNEFLAKVQNQAEGLPG
jgi:hypothetical protein